MCVSLCLHVFFMLFLSFFSVCLLVLFDSCLFLFYLISFIFLVVCLFFNEREKRRLWIWISGELGRILKKPGGNHDQTILYGKESIFNTN